MKLIFALNILFFHLYSTCNAQPENFKENAIRIINNFRAENCKCGSKFYEAAQKLKWNDTLAQVAQYHADDMFTNNFFDHIDKMGNNLRWRSNKFKYSEFSLVAENIAKGYTIDNLKQMFYDWMKSSGHCKNIMHPTLKEFGLAQKGNIWVLVLGSGN